MREIRRVLDRDVEKLDVQVLIDRMQRATNGEVILEPANAEGTGDSVAPLAARTRAGGRCDDSLDDNLLANKRLEERIEKHGEGRRLAGADAWRSGWFACHAKTRNAEYVTKQGEHTTHNLAKKTFSSSLQTALQVAQTHEGKLSDSG